MGRSRSASWSPLPAKRARPTDAGAAAVAPHKTPQKRPKLQAPPKGEFSPSLRAAPGRWCLRLALSFSLLSISWVAGGRRGAALIAAAGVKLPPPKTRAASRSPGTVATPAQRAPPRATPEVDLLASQVLPLKLKHLEDLFLAFQTVYGIARSRGLRTTYTNLRQGVQEAWGKRFLVSLSCRQSPPACFQHTMPALPGTCHKHTPTRHFCCSSAGVTRGPAADAPS